MAEQHLIPHSFSGITEYPRQPNVPREPGKTYGVYISLSPDILDPISEKIANWFQGRAEVEVIDVGVSDKQGLGFILIEWAEREIDPLFLAILRDEELVLDYTVYATDIGEV